MTNYEILHNNFNLKTHADNFINYLEVIIKPNGVIEYAVPSHQQKLEKIAIEIYGEQEFNEMLNQPESYIDYSKWLCDITGCVSVWNDFLIKPKETTKQQLKSIQELQNTYYTKMPYMALLRINLRGN